MQSLGCLLFAALGVGLTAYGGATGAGIVIGGGLLFVLIGMVNWAQLCLRLAATLEFDRDHNVVLWGNLFRHGAVSGAQIVRIKRDFKHRGMYKLLASRRTHVRFRLSVSKKAPQQEVFSAILLANPAIDARDLFTRGRYWKGIDQVADYRPPAAAGAHMARRLGRALGRAMPPRAETLGRPPGSMP